MQPTCEGCLNIQPLLYSEIHDRMGWAPPSRAQESINTQAYLLNKPFKISSRQEKQRFLRRWRFREVEYFIPHKLRSGMKYVKRVTRSHLGQIRMWSIPRPFSLRSSVMGKALRLEEALDFTKLLLLQPTMRLGSDQVTLKITVGQTKVLQEAENF